MNRTAQLIQEGQNYYSYNRKRIMIVGIVLVITVIIFSASFAARTVTAQGSAERVKLVTSVEIKAGDTLWGIASEYMSDEYSSVNDYIREIKECNGMSSDEIHSGNYIIVPYYADES
jgi:cell division protein YceG involved in septum cleavage